jgi:hypothetical protein
MRLPALSPFSPLASVLGDVQRAIDAKLYYPALLIALTIPDICSALALDNGVFVKEKHYIAFVDRYTTPPQLGLTGQDCYRLKGGVVHRADLAGHDKFSATHVVFTLPESTGGVHALSIIQGEKTAAMFDLVLFCDAMINAATAWYEDHHADPKVQENLKNLIRYCPTGLSPFVVGLPVVASGT